MNELLQAFSLGNAAILTNACLLPLYPGLIAFLAGQSATDAPRPSTNWLGVVVLAGVLSMMTLIGLLLYVLNQSFGSVLEILLPLVYLIVIAFGVLLLLDRNPFANLGMLQAPQLRNPFVTAYVYGLLFGPMTLPCTGPLILSAFALGAGNAGELVKGLLFFLAFGLGFGWPLALLPFLAGALQRRLVRFLSYQHLSLTRASGLLLIAVGLFGIFTELLPRYLPIDEVALSPTVWALYWLLTGILMAGLVIYTYLRQATAKGE